MMHSNFEAQCPYRRWVRKVVANYGVIRVMQSSFMASTKMSCTLGKCCKYTINPVSKSSMGGSKKLGEMELSRLEASVIKHCLAEFIDRSIMCVINVCNGVSVYKCYVVAMLKKETRLVRISVISPCLRARL